MASSDDNIFRLPDGRVARFAAKESLNLLVFNDGGWKPVTGLKLAAVLGATPLTAEEIRCLTPAGTVSQ
ncbi:MAG TPA: hypothetical protein ENH80_10225 [Phycisphaerae bacterium]|nr:hypothetical protein [Phycisphaerae bacterium]HDZ44303.1 hypothetical protein [Phycisphaerae bacterium]